MSQARRHARFGRSANARRHTRRVTTRGRCECVRADELISADIARWHSLPPTHAGEKMKVDFDAPITHAASMAKAEKAIASATFFTRELYTRNSA